MIDISRMGRRAVLVDTGPLFAAVDPKDQYHHRAQSDIERLAREPRPVLVLYPILWECHSLIIRRRGIVMASSWLEDVQGGGDLVVSNADDYTAAIQRLTGYGEHPITLFDAMLAVVSDRLDIPVWTFDHHFDLMRVAVWR